MVLIAILGVVETTVFGNDCLKQMINLKLQLVHPCNVILMNRSRIIFILYFIPITVLTLNGCRSGIADRPASVSSDDSVRIFQLKERADSLSWQYPDSAVQIYKQALELSRQKNFNLGITAGLTGLGFVSINHGRYADGFRYVHQAINHLKDINQPEGKDLATLYNNMGAIYLHTGDYDEAASWCIKATDIATKHQDFGFIARSANNFGAILSEMGELEKAMSYIERGKEVSAAHGITRYLSYLNLNEARILFWQNKLDEALEKCQLSARLASENGQFSAQCDAIHLSGMIHEARGALTEARESFRQVLEMPSDYPIGKLRSALSMGQLELKADNNQTAFVYLDSALQMGTRLNARKEMVDIHKALTTYYRKKEDFNRAFEHREIAAAIKDSILNLDRLNAVNLLEVRYQMAQKDKDLAEQQLMIAAQQSKLIRNNILTAGLVLIAAIIIIVLRISYRNRQRSEKQKRAIAVWQALSEGEEKERARIARELHDGIGGLLSTLKMQLSILAKRVPEVKEADIYLEADQLLDDTISEVRKTAHNLMPELILRHGLVEAIRMYCNNIQQDEGLKMDFQYYGFIGSLDSGFQLAVYRIIQELLQNILKHAHATAVLVQLSRHNDVMDITVEDNGIGFDAGSERKGMGLNSVERRVNELNGRIHINSEIGKGTNIYIEFHLTDEKQLSRSEPEAIGQ